MPEGIEVVGGTDRVTAGNTCGVFFLISVLFLIHFPFSLLTGPYGKGIYWSGLNNNYSLKSAFMMIRPRL